MQNIIDPFLVQEVADAEAIDMIQRNVFKVIRDRSLTAANMAKLWDYYNNDFEPYLVRRSQESPEDFTERMRYFTKENHCRRTVNLASSFLYGNVIGRHSLTDKAQDLLRSTWDLVGVRKFLMNAAIMASVTGFATIIPHVVNAFIGGEIKRLVSWELVDSMDSIPIPDAENPSVLAGLIIKKEIDCMLCTEPKKEVVFYFGYNVYKWVDDQFAGQFVSPIPADELACILVNPGDPMILTGRSDLEDVSPLNERLNETLTNMSMITDYYSDPIFKLIGASLPDNWRKTANAVIELDEGAEAEFLTWDANMEAMDTMVQSARTQIPIISGISSLSRSDLTNIGQIRTTGGIETAFKTDIETIRLKQIFAKEFDEKLHRSTLELYNTMGFGIVDVSVEVDFVKPERIIIKAGLEEAEAETMEFNIGKKTPEDIYRETHPDSSMQEIEREADSVVKVPPTPAVKPAAPAPAQAPNQQKS